MGLHRAVTRTGSALIDARAIRTMRGYRVVLLTQGPDLALFSSSGILARLARWLVEAMRDRVSAIPENGSKRKKSLPIVIASLNEGKGTYLVMGLNAATEFDDIRKK